MAPPGLIHSAPGLPDTCVLFQSFADAASMSGPAAETPSAIQICRIMRPDDANVAGNVHGGTILKMIEEAGAIISTRHCNSQNGERCVAALARVERTDFLSPMCIGEVAHVSAEITYTSKHSVEVQVNVMSENILTGTKKLTNKATLWYVPLSLKNVDKVLEVPPVVYSRQEQEEEGRKRYEAQKLERMETKWRNGDIVQPVPNPEPNTVSYSQSSLIHLVGPSDCTLHGFVHGGVTMKLMDEVAGIVAARHCKTNIVTASVDAINFHDKIRKGYVITISGRMTFTSNKSMEIEVLVDADPVVDNSQKRYRAASAFFTYVSLSQEGKSLPVPQLVARRKLFCHHWKPSSHQTFVNYKKDKLLILPRVEVSHSPSVPSSKCVCSRHRKLQTGKHLVCAVRLQEPQAFLRWKGARETAAGRRERTQICGPCSQRAGAVGAP
ncbi:cytosolic acyl coenzyme A thioester hydrolase isoform X5 [Felis catus]|uniref:cytosolic acyl coenzyme A thioester hydrolase isoform X5 n=1 Tax=Felis catus TaxID=9685 RepID=UPI001D19F909|nr:cytosolic acyl coenzyme A thioester hydrolase isoform X5 [Felis catus]